MSKTFVIMAGGTGGHVFPGLAVAGELTAAGYQIEWLGTANGIEATLVPDAGYRLHEMPVSGVRGRGMITLLKAPFMIVRSVIIAMQILRELRPVAVLGLGGFAAGPGAVAARLLGIPLILHEQNSVLGTTNALLQYIAGRRLEGFPNTFKRRRSTFYTGNPVRRAITDLHAANSTSTATVADAASCNILVVGGSRGARALNQGLPELFAHIKEQAGTAQLPALRIRHQSGEAEQADTKAAYQRYALDAEVTAFIDDMAAAYQWADLVVCRAGAMTVAELTSAAVAAVLVPYPFAIDDHQTENARWLQQQQAGLLMPQDTMTDPVARSKLAELISDGDKRRAMAAAAGALALPDSASQVAAHCQQLAGTEQAA